MSRLVFFATEEKFPKIVKKQRNVYTSSDVYMSLKKNHVNIDAKILVYKGNFIILTIELQKFHERLITYNLTVIGK